MAALKAAGQSSSAPLVRDQMTSVLKCVFQQHHRRKRYLKQSIFSNNRKNSLGKIASIGFACFGPLDPILIRPPMGISSRRQNPTGQTPMSSACFVRHSTFPSPSIQMSTGRRLVSGNGERAQGLNTFIYLTIGTGIGGGVFAEGKLLHGLLHPEMGHIPLPHDKSKDPFEGVCPFHGDCFEGLASGVAIEKRWGQPGGTLPPEHSAWDLEADYISRALAAYAYTISPQRIIIGGGAGQLPHLLTRIQKKTRELINGYIQSPAILEHIESYIVNPGLGNLSGVLGALALAKQALPEK